MKQYISQDSIDKGFLLIVYGILAYISLQVRSVNETLSNVLIGPVLVLSIPLCLLLLSPNKESRRSTEKSSSSPNKVSRRSNEQSSDIENNTELVEALKELVMVTIYAIVILSIKNNTEVMEALKGIKERNLIKEQLYLRSSTKTDNRALKSNVRLINLLNFHNLTEIGIKQMKISDELNSKFQKQEEKIDGLILSVNELKDLMQKNAKDPSND